MQKREMQLSAPNIVIELRDSQSELPYEYNYSLLGEFMNRVAKEYPHWRFVQQAHYGVEAIRRVGEVEQKFYRVRDFAVYYNRELLGEIACVFNRGAPCIRVQNFRVQQDMERGYGKETKDLNKAMRLVKKYFSPRTVTELVSEAEASASSAIYHAYRDKRGKVGHLYSQVTGYLQTHIVENIETIGEIAVAAGCSPNIVRELPDAYEEVQITGAMHKCYEDKNGVVVLLHGQNYVVKKAGDELPQIYTADDAPDTLKRKLGLLKLVEDGQCITDVGMRVSDLAFFIMGESA